MASFGQDNYQYGFFESDEKYAVKLPKGLSRRTIEAISHYKNEPDWMLEFRLKAYEIFEKKQLPAWGGELSTIDFQDIHYFLRASDKQMQTWEDVPEEIKRTFDKIGVPEAERKFLAGVSNQYDSEVVYHNLKGQWEKQGVVFVDTDTAVREYPDLMREYFGTIIPPADNKFAALNSAVWSGGSFIYVPKGVHVEIPLQAYFRINAANAGQFERTLIIADEGSFVHYIEGCSAPIYTTDSLHSAVVEIVCKAGSRVRYTTIQNWSHNVYNLVTKRAFVYKDATMEWVDGNIGCLAEGSTVTTPTGIKPIESLDIGDEVLAYDDNQGALVFRKVLAKKFSGYKPVHTLTVGERVLRATSNHPFYSYIYSAESARKNGRYALDYLRADEVEKVIVPITSIEYGKPYSLIFPSTETSFRTANQYSDQLEVVRARDSVLKANSETDDDLMWLFGYWVGDGDIEIKYGENDGVIRWARVGFSSPQDDRAREKLMRIMSAMIDVEPEERNDGVHVRWNSKELAEFFMCNGFFGKASAKRIPQWVWSLPESQRLAFVAGYVDADGCLLSSKRRFSLKSVNKLLLKDTAVILTGLGITAKLYTEFEGDRETVIMNNICVAHGSHRLEFRIDQRILRHTAEEFSNKHSQLVAPTVIYNRKVGRSVIELPDSVELYDVEVSALSEMVVPTWDIEVEGTGNFVSEGFIVHNSKLTMKYPAVFLMEPGARGEVLSLAYAGMGQHQDAGGKAIHLAPHTNSLITSKSISMGGGRSSYRGMLKVVPKAYGCKSTVKCDALLLDDLSISDTYPVMQIDNGDVTIAHEATVGKIGAEQVFYLQSRGLDEDQAAGLIVQGFVEPIIRELPMEYAVELNRLISLSMEGSVG